MNPLEKEQLRTLAHDLNSCWGVINWAVHLLNKTGLSKADRSVFEDVLSRNIMGLQAILTQLAGHLSVEPHLPPVVDLLSKLEGPKSLPILAQLEPLLVELKHLLRVALVQ